MHVGYLMTEERQMLCQYAHLMKEHLKRSTSFLAIVELILYFNINKFFEY
jgi:hypothetical protein